MFGLSPKTLAAIIQCLQQYPEIAWVKIYGSRAMGNYQRGSDIDLAYSSPADITGKLHEALDNLPTPYLFDVTHYESLAHEGLKAHIDRVGVMLYPVTTPVRPESFDGAQDRLFEGRESQIPVRPELVEGQEPSVHPSTVRCTHGSGRTDGEALT
jgi:predicted nucleotidyltransferase